MFKNSVFLESVDTKKWLVNAGIRALKTFCQTLLGFVVVGMSMSEIQWGYAFSVAGVATVASVLTSLSGIPEVKSKESEEE